MNDRLTLANALEEALTAVTAHGSTVSSDVNASIVRAKAERLATVIFDVIHENVATKADVDAAGATLRSEIGIVRADVTGLRGEVTLVEHRLFTRLGSLAVVLAGAIVAGLH